MSETPLSGTWQVDPVDVVAEVRNLVGDGSWTPVCDTCAAVAAAVRQVDPGDADAYLTQVADVLRAHPTGADFVDPAGYDRCDYDLTLAYDAAVLGRAGVALMASWGPPHRAGHEHPADWRDCASCVMWVADRAWARQRLRAAGLDDVVLLGSDDRLPRG